MVRYFFADQNVLRKQRNSDMYIFNIDKAFVLNITLSCWFASFRWQIEFQKSREFFINHFARVSRSMIYVEYFSPYMTTQRVPFKFFCFFHVKIVKSTKKNDKFSFFVSFSRFHKSIFHYCLTPNDKSPLLSCLMSSLKEREMSKKERKKKMAVWHWKLTCFFTFFHWCF